MDYILLTTRSHSLSLPSQYGKAGKQGSPWGSFVQRSGFTGPSLALGQPTARISVYACSNKQHAFSSSPPGKQGLKPAPSSPTHHCPDYREPRHSQKMLGQFELTVPMPTEAMDKVI